MSGFLGNAYAIDLPQSALPIMTLSNVIAVIAIVTHGKKNFTTQRLARRHWARDTGARLHCRESRSWMPCFKRLGPTHKAAAFSFLKLEPVCCERELFCLNSFLAGALRARRSIEGSRTMRNRPYPVLECSRKKRTDG